MDPTASELAAQLSMAKSAELALILTAAQVVIAVLGTIGLFVTIRYTQRSLAMTREALTLQMTTSRQQLRAYVGFDQGDVHDVKVGQIPTAILKITNHGQTPAQDVTISLTAQAFDRTEGIAFQDADPFEQRVTINPGQTITPFARLTKDGAPVVLTSALLAELETPLGHGGASVAFHGWFRFTDIFGEVRTQSFAYALFGPALGQYQTMVRQDGFAEKPTVPRQHEHAIANAPPPVTIKRSRMN